MNKRNNLFQFLLMLLVKKFHSMNAKYSFNDSWNNLLTVLFQDGYSDEIATIPGNIHYKCASSAAWISEDTLDIQVQIIDKYFGVLNMRFGFKENRVAIQMHKVAEDFLKEYSGFATGYIQK